MNLNEQTNRIKKMMGLLTEMDDTKEYEISYKFNPEIVKLQKELVDLGFDIGEYGPKGDGVDGLYGPLTDAAYKAFKEGKSSEDYNPKDRKSTRLNSSH